MLFRLITGNRVPPEQETDLLLRALNLRQDAGPRPTKNLNYHKSAGRVSAFSHDSALHDSQAEEVFLLRVLPITTASGGSLSAPDGFSQSAPADCITDCRSSRQGIITLILLCPK